MTSGPRPGDDGGSPPLRLDVALVQRGLARSRAQARELVEAGHVTVDGRAQTKTSSPVAPDELVELTREPDVWVGRAAYKLLGAFDAFGPQGFGVEGARCLDVGASTGGFTQVLLARGAAHVTALDVGHGQLVAIVADDPRVAELSGTNIRDVEPGGLGEAYEVVVADLSFISLRLALPPMVGQLAERGDLVALVKPQFEVGRERLARTGVVSSRHERRRVLREVVSAAVDLGLVVQGLAASPLPGGDGNREYLLWVRRGPAEGLDADAVAALVDRLTAD